MKKFIMILWGLGVFCSAYTMVAQSDPDVFLKNIDRQVVFVGVTHDPDSSQLMNAFSRKYFNRYIIPALERDTFPPERTVVLVEGMQSISYKFSNYPVEWKGFELMDTASWVVFTDPRQHDVGEDIYDFLDSLIVADAMNRELETGDVLDYIQRPIIIDPKLLTPDIKQKALAYVQNNRKFELHTIQMAKHLADSGYRVVVVQGVIHTLRESMFMLDFPCGIAMFSNSGVAPLGTKNMCLAELISGALTDPLWYSWRHFELDVEDMPEDYVEPCRNIVFTGKDSLIRKKYRPLFGPDVSVISVHSSALHFTSCPKTGDELIFCMKDGSQHTVQYLGDEAISHNNLLRDIRIYVDFIPYQLGFKGMSFVVPRGMEINMKEISFVTKGR